MQQFTSIYDVPDVQKLVQLAAEYSKNPHQDALLGQHKTLVLLFFNPSLRTQLSTQKAGMNLGMQVISMNASQGWQLEFEEGVVMRGDKAEHIKEAAAVISQYADIIGVRTFPSLQDKERDYQDFVLQKFIQYARVPVISLESAILHPLQSLADWLTIEQYRPAHKPKVVLSWAPHPRALPQAVPNSFAEWMNHADVDFVITHPKGYELDERFSGKARIEYDQDKAFDGADFIYGKNWSSYSTYGQILLDDPNWTISAAKMARTNNAFFMHCLPVRRNVVVSDAVLDSARSLVIEQANNRTFAAQAVLSAILSK